MLMLKEKRKQREELSRCLIKITITCFVQTVVVFGLCMLLGNNNIVKFAIVAIAEASMMWYYFPRALYVAGERDKCHQEIMAISLDCCKK